jgi:arylsulfatase
MSQRPNILHIFTDQQRGDTIAALGNPVIRTPNLDRLCAEGTAFTNAYTPDPVCVPARCSMIYGQYPHRTGCYENNFEMPADESRTFMAALTRAGYRTHGIGKCHFTPDPHAMRGFQTRRRQEELVGGPDIDEYLKHLHDSGFDYICDPHGVRGEMYYIPQVAQMPAKLHPTQWIGDESISFIEEEAKTDRPWYCFTSFVHPHPPFAPPNPWHKLYRAPLMPLPKVPADYESLHTHINRHQNRYKYRDQGIDQNLLRCLKAHYYAAISFIDYQVGRILQALEKAGQLDNTLIVYTADHGEMLGDYHCFGKRCMLDSAARVPLIARLPGRFGAGERVARPASLVDLAPTFAAASGAGMDSDSLDGVDLADLAAGTCDREMVFSQHDCAGAATYMAVSEGHKYMYSAADGREWLFDRAADPQELRSRAGLPFCRDSRDAMKNALIQHLRSGGEVDALDDDDWKQYPRREMSTDPDANLLIQDHRWAQTTIPGYSD